MTVMGHHKPLLPLYLAEQIIKTFLSLAPAIKKHLELFISPFPKIKIQNKNNSHWLMYRIKYIVKSYCSLKTLDDSLFIYEGD